MNARRGIREDRQLIMARGERAAINSEKDLLAACRVAWRQGINDVIARAEDTIRPGTEEGIEGGRVGVDIVNGLAEGDGDVGVYRGRKNQPAPVMAETSTVAPGLGAWRLTCVPR